MCVFLNGVWCVLAFLLQRERLHASNTDVWEGHCCKTTHPHSPTLGYMDALWTRLQLPLEHLLRMPMSMCVTVETLCITGPLLGSLCFDFKRVWYCAASCTFVFLCSLNVAEPTHNCAVHYLRCLTRKGGGHSLLLSPKRNTQ